MVIDLRNILAKFAVLTVVFILAGRLNQPLQEANAQPVQS